MHRRHTTFTILGLVMALATIGSVFTDARVLTGDRFFVFDPGAGQVYLAVVEAGDACSLSGLPIPPKPPRRSPCGVSSAECARTTGSSARSCGGSSGGCLFFALGSSALHAPDAVVIDDDGPALSRPDTFGRAAVSRDLRPPVPPPRTA